MKIRKIIISLLVTLFVAFNQNTQAQKKPNIIYILVDDLGYGDINLENESFGVFNNPNIKTPELAKLAAESLVFGHHYCSSPVCSPSRAGLLTGRTPTRCNINLYINDKEDNDSHFLRGEEITIPEMLKQKDYETAIFGKWHLNGADWEDKKAWTGWTGSFPKQQGFDYGIVTKEDPHFTRHLNVNTQKHPGDFFTVDGEPLGPIKGYSSDIISQFAIQWLEQKRNTEKPFFMYLSYDAVHIRIAAADKYTNMYNTGNARKDEYYANITHLDAAIGEIMQAIKENELDENTIIFFSSDNGPDVLHQWDATYFCYGTSYPLYGQKYQLYQGGIRVPGMVRWLGEIESGFTNAPNSTLDVLPTLADIVGASMPEDRLIDGESIKSLLLEGGPIQRNKPMYWQYEYPKDYPEFSSEKYNSRFDARVKSKNKKLPHVLIRDGNYILYGIHDKNFELPAEYQLFNIISDPEEKYELSSEKPELLKKLKEKLATMYFSVNEDRKATSEFIKTGGK